MGNNQDSDNGATLPAQKDDNSDVKRVMKFAQTVVNGIISGPGHDKIEQEYLDKITKDSIKIAKASMAKRFLFLNSVLKGAIQGDPSATVNSLFGGALGLMSARLVGPKGAQFVGAAATGGLDWISDKTHEYQIGEKIYDAANGEAEGKRNAFRALQGNPYPTQPGASVDGDRVVTDSSGTPVGYFRMSVDKDANELQATMFTPNHVVAREVVISRAGNIVVSGSGVSYTMDKEGDVSGELAWQPGQKLQVNDKGEIIYYGCSFKLGKLPFDGMTIGCGSSTYQVKPDAKISFEGQYVVVRNADGDNAPNLLLTRVGGALLRINRDTKEVEVKPFGTFNWNNVQNVGNWLDSFGYKDWTQRIEVGNKGWFNLKNVTIRDVVSDNSGQQPISSGENTSGPDGPNSSAPELTFNLDGSGKVVSEDTDGTKISESFDSPAGCVKLADIIGTFPEVVAAYPERFALRYAAMSGQRTPRSLSETDSGDEASNHYG